MDFPSIIVGDETYTFYPNTGYVCVKSQSRCILINLRAHESFVVCEIGARTKIIRKTNAGHSHDFWCASTLAAEAICEFLCNHMNGEEVIGEYTMISHGHDSCIVLTSALGQKNSTITKYSSVGSAKNAWDEFDYDVRVG